MKLAKKEKEILINWGYSENDIKQIERLKYKFTIYNERISCKKVKELIKPEDFLSGIARSAFHCTAIREDILIESNLLEETS